MDDPAEDRCPGSRPERGIKPERARCARPHAPRGGASGGLEGVSDGLGGAEDAIVSDEQAFSNTQSVLIQDGGAQDVLLRFDDESTGVWTVDWMMYVPVGNNAYYNFQGANAPGGAYIAEIYFNETNGTPGEGAWAGTAFTYPEGEWFAVEHLIDLNNDLITATINGTVVGSFPYTTVTGDLLSSVDFFSADPVNKFPRTMSSSPDPENVNPDLALNKFELNYFRVLLLF